MVRIANQQNEEILKTNPARPGASRMVHSAGAAPALSVAAASSPGNNARRDKAVTSGKRNKQIVPYDPAMAGKTNENRGNASRGNSGERNHGRVEKDGGSRGNGDIGRREPARGNHENNTPVEVRRELPLNPQPRHEPRLERETRPARHNQINERYNDGYSEMEYAIHGKNNHYGVQDRILYRDLPSNDARVKLDRLYQSELLEEQGPPGPTCFGPRIMGEPPVPNFQLARGTKTYNGSTKPQDWLIDYATAVKIAGGNLRWAIRYVPQMLEGPARVWLNNLPAGRINCWLDFEEMFVSNFTSTYKRPNRPQQLAMCKQRPNETDREFLTRWCNLRNSCEGVIESKAISWFAQGCRYGSVLWQRLQRDMPTTLAETIRIADSYALGDPTQPELMSAEHREHQDQYARDAARSSRRNEFRGRIREERPDYRYASNQVAAVVQDQPSQGNSQRQKNGPQQWTPRNEGKRQWTPEQKKQ